MAQLLSGPALPTAVFAEYDELALGHCGRYAGPGSGCPRGCRSWASTITSCTGPRPDHRGTGRPRAGARSPPGYCCKPWRHRRATNPTPTSSSRPTSSSAPAQLPHVVPAAGTDHASG